MTIGHEGFDKKAVIAQLERILECELAGVVRDFDTSKEARALG